MSSPPRRHPAAAALLARVDMSPRARVGWLAAGVLAPVLGLLVVLPDATVPARETSAWWLVALVAAFAISERLVFHVEARNEAVSYSPTDIPLAIGVLLVAPVVLVAARIVGSTIGLVAVRRPPVFKLVLNLTAFVTETVVAVVIVRLAFGPSAEASLWLWAVLAAALILALAVGGVTIANAIAFFEGDRLERVRKELIQSPIFHFPGALFGASIAVSMLVEPWLAVLFLAPAPIVWLVMRSHGMLMHRFSDLRQVHEFSSLVSGSTHPDDVAETAVIEIATNLRATSAALCAWDRGPGTVRAGFGDPRLLDAMPTTADDDVWAELLDGSFRILDTGEAAPALAARLTEIGIDHAAVAPLVDDRGVLGLLVVADRQGVADRFNDDDCERLRSIARQLTIAVRKAQLNVRIQHDATHDLLTDLPNRSYFEAWTAEALASAGETSVLMLDLDRFKEVNDTLGHHTGDLLLLEVTERIRATIADDDLAARFGGDEFAITVPGAGEVEACLLAERLSEMLERPFVLDGTTVAIAASIGIALAPKHGDDVSGLLRRADLAMYNAKRRHDRMAVFHDTLEGNDSARLALLGDFRDALHYGTLDVHFQPKVDLDSGVVADVEALARWTHPTHGAVGPDVFVPLAEQTGLIGELTAHVLDRSLAAVRHWEELGYRIGVAVNVSPQSLVNEELPAIVAERLRAADVPADRLTLEITEQTALGETPRTMRILEHLADIGVRISIDDFGTGHSSLANLRHLPISELKIDRSFVSEMLLAHHDEVIVKAIVDLGHNLGFSVVAEGVETPDTQDELRAIGCDVAQGYGICRPLPIDKLDTWLASASVARIRRNPRSFDLRVA